VGLAVNAVLQVDRTKPLAATPGRYCPLDALIAFLEAL